MEPESSPHELPRSRLKCRCLPKIHTIICVHVFGAFSKTVGKELQWWFCKCGGGRKKSCGNGDERSCGDDGNRAQRMEMIMLF
uniref:Uncharacterized protein n=1 Tax=Brassica oleracea TaxID=3712 RepID=A0A3P6CJZ9_BRAOL|nr:unnamed protein product [Brassica oleracea]